MTYSVPLEGFDRLFISYPTDVYNFICWTWCETSIVLPVDIQRGSYNKRYQQYCKVMPLIQWRDIQSVLSSLHCRGQGAWDTGIFLPAFHLPIEWWTVGVNCPICFPSGAKKKKIWKKDITQEGRFYRVARPVIKFWLIFTPVTSLLPNM